MSDIIRRIGGDDSRSDADILALRAATERSLTETERALLDRYVAHWAWVERRSEREFDLSTGGREPETVDRFGNRTGGWLFQAWLPLAVIREHPSAWFHEDWSFTRDAERDEIWAVFDDIISPAPRGRRGRPAEGILIEVPPPGREFCANCGDPADGGLTKIAAPGTLSVWACKPCAAVYGQLVARHGAPS